jgi:hypothetical protein
LRFSDGLCTLLSALFFRLGIEQRLAQISACARPASCSDIRRLFLIEAAAVIGVGVVGAALAVGWPR